MALDISISCNKCGAEISDPTENGPIVFDSGIIFKFKNLDETKLDPHHFCNTDCLSGWINSL